MAIFDNDGTVNREVGKVYDNDGTVAIQIDKVYDNNGTTNGLIYQSWDGTLYENGNAYVEFTGGYVGSGYVVPYYAVDNLLKYNTHMTFGNPGGDNTAICGTNLPVDLTMYSTLMMEYTGTGESPLFSFGVAQSKTVSFVHETSLYVGTNIATIDISRLTGRYYIASQATRRGFVTVKKIYLK